MGQVKKQAMTRPIWLRSLILFFVYLALLAAVGGAAFVTIRAMLEETRGLAYDAAGVANGSPLQMGVNAALEQYSDTDLRRTLEQIRANRLTLVRQHFYWNDIEPRPGELLWDQSDRIVARADESQIGLIAVLDTTPAWARHPGERDLVDAAPEKVEDYARFVAAFVRRYGDRVGYVQIWDNPNVHPYWGRRNASPVEYTALLRAGATAARTEKPGIQVLSAGLAPNTELVREHPDYSDVLFLRGMYEAGARDYFDILAAKPYGMWTGPEDRRVASEVLNFPRVILLREEMNAYGDGGKPVWAVEFGWNALPVNWEGKSSPWGTDTEEVQSARLESGILRARREWSWLKALIIQTWQPNAPADDAGWGFALVGLDGKPRLFLSAVAGAISTFIEPAQFDQTRFFGGLSLLGLVALAALWRGTIAARRIPWANGWRALVRFRQLPELLQLGILAMCTLAFYVAPNTILSLGLLGLIILLFALRIDLAFLITVCAIPLYLFPKNLIGSMQFSLVELLTLAAAAGWLLSRLLESEWARPPLDPRKWGLASMDWVVVAFVLIGILSVKVATNFGVANREFRVIVLEPALLYALIRAARLAPRDLHRIMDAFILSALAISLVGLYQYFFTDYVIIGEGVRRILAVYGSPNNLALYLDRVLPLLAVFVLLAGDKRRQIGYLIAAVPIAACWYLTYSRGAWFGVGAALILIGLVGSRRIRFVVPSGWFPIVALLVAGAVIAIPFLTTERAQSLFQTGTGTGFFRVSVWQSGVEMIRDHPLWGVGLDNFLYQYPHYIKPDAWREPNLSHPHNILLDFWVRLGILGVLVLAWMLAAFYRSGLRLLEPGNPHRVLALGLLASMTAALAHGLIDAAFFYVDLAFVWMLTLAVITELSRQN